MREKKHEIDTVSDITSLTFSKDYFHERKPVLIKGGASASVAFQKWYPDYLKEKSGNREVQLNYSESGIYGYNKKILTMPFKSVVDLLVSDRFNKGAAYLTKSSIPDCFPELLEDLEQHKWSTDNDIVSETNLWFGCGGCVTPLHFDNAQNFLYQIRGTKSLTLFSPSDTEYLYLDKKSANQNISKLNLDDVDEKQFPDFKKAIPYYVTLDAGDILYMPAFWWHYVRSLEMAISVNFWWHRFELVEGSGVESLNVEEVTKEIKYFLDNGIRIDQPDYTGEVMLINACRKGLSNVVTALLQLGADANTKSQVHKKGTPAIFYSISRDDVETLKQLLSYGADLTIKGPNGCTAFQYAMQGEHVHMAQLLTLEH